MAMIKCPECGQEISDKAKKCIHCGNVLIEDKPKTKICNECGKEISFDIMECPFCGCPFDNDINTNTTNIELDNKPKKDIKKKVIPAFVGVLIVVIIFSIYYISIVRPNKIEAQNKATYDEAINLLERGKYEDGQELLETISSYKDVSVILEQIKWESYVYECINDFKQWLKNPDSFTLYEVAFYLDDESHGMYASLLGDVDFSYPAIVFRSGAQNGFGGNTTGYELFYYFVGDGYTCVGSCNSLNEDDYYNSKGELKDEDNGVMDVLLCMEINALIEEAEHVGNVDMDRIRILIKNDSYSAIKIID